MRSGPLRRIVAVVGLLALVPTAWLLATGAVTPVQAAVRALATLGTVLLVGRLVAWWLGTVARRMERAADTRARPAPRRRRTDRPADDAQQVGGVAAG